MENKIFKKALKCCSKAECSKCPVKDDDDCAQKITGVFLELIKKKGVELKKDYDKIFDI